MTIRRTIARRGVRPSGFTLTELIVSATLLVAIMGIVAPLTVRSGRLWQDARRQGFATDELMSELERLIALPPRQRQPAINDLAPSKHLLAAFPDAEITAETIRDRHGTRLVLRLTAQRDEVRTSTHATLLPAIELVGWLDPLPDENSAEETLSPEETLQ